MIDIHCHILPGIDDGAENWDLSLKMARIAAKDGITGIVCTPHWSPSFPNNSREVILPLVEEFRSRLSEAGIPIEIYPGCEMVMHFNLPEKIEADELLTINDNGKFALVEMPHEIIPPNVDHLFWMLRVKGVTPILGHPERNWMVMKKPKLMQKWVEGGVLVQITAASLAGHFGREVRDLSIDFLQRRMVHFVATDSHNCGRRKPVLSEARELTASLIGSEEAERIFSKIPAAIIRGELPEISEPLPPMEKRSTFFDRFFSLKRDSYRKCG